MFSNYSELFVESRQFYPNLQSPCIWRLRWSDPVWVLWRSSALTSPCGWRCLRDPTFSRVSRIPTCNQGCGVLIFVGLRLQGFKKIGTSTPALKKFPDADSGLVGHRLLNLCDCDGVLSERCRHTDSQDFFKQSISIRSYLNLISVIACSKTVHNIIKQNLNYRHQHKLSNVLVAPTTARLCLNVYFAANAGVHREPGYKARQLVS